jgi:propionyl-CoA carboxylase alpha chain
MLAKLVAHAPTRAEAIRKLAGALRRARVNGVPTNLALLRAAVEHPDFAAGRIDTQWLERIAAPSEDDTLRALAAALAGQAVRRAGQTLPSGWRNNASQLQRSSFVDYDVGYRLADGVFEVNGEHVAARVVSCTPDLVELEVEGVRRAYDVQLVGDTAYVEGVAFRELDRFPSPESAEALGSLVSPMPGSIVRVAVEPGQDVDAGQPLVVLDAMKMEHTISAPRAGRIADVRVVEGEQVDGGRVLVVFE